MTISPYQSDHRIAPGAIRPHSGLATLLFCMILLAAATTLIFTLTRTSLAEQRIMGNEYRIETLRQACEAGLNYGVAWLRLQEPAWQTDGSGQYSLTAPLPADNLGQQDDIHIQVGYLSKDIDSPFILVQAQASHDSNHDSRYTMRQFVHYSIINGHSNNPTTQVIIVPGTWHDYQ